jgi:hypothetical protein
MGGNVMTTQKRPLEQALAATPDFPQDAAAGALVKIRRRIMVATVARFSGLAVTAALLVFVGNPLWRHSVPPRFSAEVVEELQYVHECLWDTDTEITQLYASVF